MGFNSMPPGGGAPPPPAPMGGAPAGGGMDFASSLAELQASLPPDMQSKLDPQNPITQLLFKRLRDGISEEEGQALLMLFGNAEPMALAGMKKFLPEIIVLLDIFDDGELNNSIGEGDGPGMDDSAGHERAESPSYEAREEDEDEEGSGGAMSRLNAVRV